jgi:hypothetical protein
MNGELVSTATQPAKAWSGDHLADGILVPDGSRFVAGKILLQGVLLAKSERQKSNVNVVSRDERERKRPSSARSGDAQNAEPR